MTNTETQTAIDILSAAGFIPADDLDLPGMAGRTVLYYGDKGWDAVREDVGGLTFVGFDDGLVKLMVTTSNGVITDEARFNVSSDRGTAMLIAAVNA